MSKLDYCPCYFCLPLSERPAKVSDTVVSDLKNSTVVVTAQDSDLNFTQVSDNIEFVLIEKMS